MSRIFILILVALVFNPVYGVQFSHENLGWPGTTLEGRECQGQRGGFGPFDYNDHRISVLGGPSHTAESGTKQLRVVEVAHFPPHVENLIKGNRGKLPSDIDYTLRAFPNHHRALWAMARFFLRMPKDDPNTQRALAEGFGGSPPPECYFQRAKLFSPEDPMVSMVFGIYLHKRGMPDAAIEEYRLAEQNMPEHAELFYNTGLAYFDLKDYETAKKFANRAYKLGYPLPGLKRKLAGVDISLTHKPEIE